MRKSRYERVVGKMIVFFFWLKFFYKSILIYLSVAQQFQFTEHSQGLNVWSRQGMLRSEVVRSSIVLKNDFVMIDDVPSASIPHSVTVLRLDVLSS